MNKKLNILVSIVLFLSIVLASCAPSAQSTGPVAPKPSGSKQLNIFIGSEQETVMNAIVVPWCKSQGWDCQFRKKGSVDQKVILQSGVYTDNDGWQADAFWFASSVWPTIGDTKGVLVDKQSMFLSPTVFATWKHIADANGWTGKESVPLLDIFNTKNVRIWWSNPSQSNSGATEYLALLTADAGNQEGVPLTAAQVNDPTVQTKVRAQIRSIDHSSPSTKDVTDNCIANPDKCDGVFTYEALVTEDNPSLVAAGKEPLYVVYPSELALSDAYLAFAPNPSDSNNADKKSFFESLQKYLTSDSGTSQLLAHGRRAGSDPLNVSAADQAVFNPNWGIHAKLTSAPITLPGADVINSALEQYQTSFRAPVDGIYCLDTSGSMGAGRSDTRWSQVVVAMKSVLDKTEATKYQLLTHPQDLTSALFFTDSLVYQSNLIQGNDYTQLGQLYNDIAKNDRSGGTNMYQCLETALDQFATHPKLDGRRKIIFLMTDGQSGGSPDNFLRRIQSDFSGQVTVIAIGFSNEADGTQLHSVTDLTEGTVIYTDAAAYQRDHKTNKMLAASLPEAMKDALGYK